MSVACPQCSSENRDGAFYCANCGHRLSDPPIAGTKILTCVIPPDPGQRTIGEGVDTSVPLPAGMPVGNWVIERVLGKGGMGTVYLARHSRLGKHVALKALSPLLTGDPGFRARFEREASTQSRLQHPNIAQVIDYVEQDGGYFFVVEHLSGGTLRDLVQRQNGPLDPARAIAIARQALAGLAFAHARHIVHRDVTSANVMLDAFGAAKVTDFGIALIQGSARETSRGVSLGTSQYMSPEQIRRPLEIDPRTDIYSLAIVLYELLTGRVPFDSDNNFEVLRAQVLDPPAPPRAVNPAIPPALEAALLKALAKNPSDRYQTCDEFSFALEAVQAPTLAAPPPPPPLPKPEPPKPAPRPKRSSAGALVLLLLAAIVVGGWYIYSKTATPPGPHYQFLRALEGHSSTVMSLAFSPDGQTLASGSADGTLKLWSTSTWTDPRTAKGGYTNSVNSVAFSPDGKTLASGNQNWTVKLWSVSDAAEIDSWEAGRGSVESVAFSPDGELLAVRHSMNSAALVWAVKYHVPVASLTGHQKWVTDVAFSPDNRTLASAALDGIKLWSLLRMGASVEGGSPVYDARETRTLTGAPIRTIAFSPDGKTLASGGQEGVVELWSVEMGASLRKLTGHTAGVNAVAFTPDGKYLASGSDDSTVRLWAPSDGARLQILTGHKNGVKSVAFSPDGKTLATGSLDSTIRLWRAQ